MRNQLIERLAEPSAEKEATADSFSNLSGFRYVPRLAMVQCWDLS
jgi:hypothetical protein